MDGIDEASRYTKHLALLAAVVLLLVVVLSLPVLKHSQPASDCSQPYDYPICKRTVTPAVYQEPSLPFLLIALLAGVALALSVVIVSYRASVVKQASIITPTANFARQAVQSQTSVAQQAAVMQQATPTTAVTPPVAQPALGVDATQLTKETK